MGAGMDAEAIVQNPLRVPGLSPNELGNSARVIEISGGDLHTLFLTSDGRVYACGRADAAALGLDGVAGPDDEDDAEGLELDGERAEGGPAAVEVPGGGEGDGEAAGDALDGAADGRGVVAGKLFLGCELGG